MICPLCGSDSKIIKKATADMSKSEKIPLSINKRRRECLSCGARFNTVERYGDVKVSNGVVEEVILDDYR